MKVKVISDVTKSFCNVVGKIIEPHGLDKAILNSNVGIIEEISKSSHLNPLDKAAIINNYKQIIKEYKNCEEVIDKAKALGIDFESLIELQNLGLLQCNFEKEFIFTGRKYLVYGNRVIEVYGTQKSKKKIKVGNVLLTKNGQTLYEIVDPIYKEFDNNILEFIVDKLIKRKCEIIINNKRID